MPDTVDFQCAWLAVALLSLVDVGASQAADSLPTTPTIPASTFVGGPKLDSSQAGFYRLKIGKLDVTALSDGTIDADTPRLLRNAKPGEVERLLAGAFVKTPSASINAYLIHLGGRLILVDAGAGGLVGPTLGKLPEALRSAGTLPEQITDVLITHIHPDHTGGLTAAGREVFPNATLHIDAHELAFWTSKSAAAESPEPNKSYFAHVDETLAPYVSGQQIKTFAGEAQLFPGLRAIPAYGHTPGHTYYVLEDGGDKLAFWGDTVHVPDVQFRDPTITIDFDVDQKQAALQRERAFADAAKEGYLVALDHVYFPGIGHLRTDGDHYSWIALPYVNDATKH